MLISYKARYKGFLSSVGRPSPITLLTTKIYITESKDKFLYIRIVLEVFVLYSITILDFA